MVLKDLKEKIAELTTRNGRASETATFEDAGMERPVEIGTVFEILKNHRRRYVLRALIIEDGKAAMDELVEQVAAWELSKPIEKITTQERKRVYISLYQTHLPRMDDVSVISHNKENGVITQGKHFDFFREYLPPERTKQ